MSEKELKKKISVAIGTIYLLLLIALSLIYIMYLNGTMVGFAFAASIPIIAAVMLIESNLKNIKSKINSENYPLVKKTVLINMLLIAIICLLSSIVTLVSHTIATALILYYLNPVKK